ncbi:MAG: hypothetical protein ACI9U2_000560 [Bradymonadia bacterium]
MLSAALTLLIGLTAPPPVVVACIDADPLSEAAVAVVAARVTAARVVARVRCPASGHRVRIVERGGPMVGTVLELQTPDGRRLRRRLPWLASAEGGWMQTAMADQLGVLAARLAGLLAEAQLSAPAGPVVTASVDAPPVDAASPRSVKRRTPAPPPTKPSRIAASAPQSAPSPAPEPLPPAPPPEASILTAPAPPIVVAAVAPIPVSVASVTPATVSAAPVTPRPEAGWQIGADMGARIRGAAGIAPDTALRLGWRRFMAEVAWQPAVDLDAEGRPLRVQGLAFAMGVEWPGWRSQRVRLSVPLSALVERLAVQRLDVPGVSHTLWQGGARAGVRVAFRLMGSWFLEGSVDGRVTPIGRIQVVDGPELSFNQLGARMGLGLVFLPGR